MDESLPSNRVFLIRLSSGAGPSGGNQRGRIEHIRSGRTKRFSSLDKVEEFISEVLSEEDHQEMASLKNSKGMHS
jgi:hypothetical protein